MCICPCFFSGTAGGERTVAQVTDEDTVSGRENFTDGSSLIPRAWPRVAASGGWRGLITAVCDNQRAAVIGMFYGKSQWSHGCTSHVRLVRTTRQCLEKA